ncbi:MAG: TolC family protein [Nitrospira sp.]|nr:TolC family protein [Nitrospira sp.]
MPSRLLMYAVGLSVMAVSGHGWIGAAMAQSTEAPREFNLDEIVKVALEEHPAIMDAGGIFTQQEGERLAAGAYPNPSITVQTGSGAVRDPRSNLSRTEYQLTLSQKLEWIGTRLARQDAADAALAGAAIGKDEVKLNVLADVKVAFYELLLAQQVVEIAMQNRDTVGGVARAVKARVESGEGARFESVKAEVEVMKADQEVSSAENVVQAKRAALNALTAGALGRRFTINGRFHAPLGALVLDDLQARALTGHPTVRRIQKAVERAGHTIDKERQSRIPDVTAFGGYAREIGREAVVAGLTVPTPLWYRREGEITTALGTKRRSEADLLRAQSELAKAITEHLQDAETASRKIGVFEKGLLKQAQEALRISQMSFRFGSAGLLEVLDAQRVARQVQLEYAQAQRDLSLAVSRLERAVGEQL